MNRRFFLKTAAGAAAFLAARKRARAAFQPSIALQKFIQPLPTLAQMLPAVPVAYADPNVDYYEIAMREFKQRLHPALGDTRLWGYCNKAGAAQAHLGGGIIANFNRPVRVRYFNELPDFHFLPVDNSVLPPDHAAAAAYPNRACPHLHGGKVHWVSDGGPFHWFTPGPDTVYGPSVPVGGWLPDPAGTMTNDYWYPNKESARLMWYHDHAVGNTRLNAYAGLAAPYILRDKAEAALIASGAIPAREIPLVFQDKVFADLGGSLWYPDAYDSEQFDLEPPANPPTISVNPEFWGDTMLANGLVYPFLEVEPRRYRFRILNACNTRFLKLRLVVADSTYNTEPGAGPAMPIRVIGTEGGFLDPTLSKQGVVLTELLLGPAERADAIIDFSTVPAGTKLIVANSANVPFPDGDPAVTSTAGYGPDAVTLLQIRVGSLVGPADPPAPAKWVLPKAALLVPPALGPLPLPAGAFIRDLTLNEEVDEYGRLMPTLGTTTPLTGESYGRKYLDPATETPANGAIEVWRIFNRTADAHPIHFHLANAQVLSRQPFADITFALAGVARGPEPFEIGWKDTVVMYPGECTIVAMQFALPPRPEVVVNGAKTKVNVPLSTRTGGHEYVWHCHILEHEEHDMMRPLVVF